MGKFKKELVAEIKKEHEQEKAQKKLREKYDAPEDVVIVEKDNTIKFFVRTFGTIIKVTVAIIIFLLTVIGITSLIYPETRNELIHQGFSILNELKGYIGMKG